MYVVDPIRIELSRKDAYVADDQTIARPVDTNDTQGNTLDVVSTSDFRKFFNGLLRVETRHQVAALKLIISHTRSSAWAAAQMYVSTLLAEDEPACVDPESRIAAPDQPRVITTPARR